MTCQGKLQGLLHALAITPPGLEGEAPSSLFLCFFVVVLALLLKQVLPPRETCYTNPLLKFKKRLCLPDPPTPLLQYDNLEGVCSSRRQRRAVDSHVSERAVTLLLCVGITGFWEITFLMICNRLRKASGFSEGVKKQRALTCTQSQEHCCLRDCELI